MGQLIPAGVLADLRATVTRSLPETATIVRTDAPVACRVQKDTQYLNYQTLPGLPRFVRVQRWIFTFPVGTDLVTGDTFTTTSGGTYRVTQIEQPRSYATSVMAYGLMTRSDAMPFPVFTNATVAFLRGRETIATVPVIVQRINAHDVMDAMAVGFEYYIAWQTDLTYTDGSPIQAGDQVVWTELANGQATIHNPIRVYGSIPMTYAVFKERE